MTFWSQALANFLGSLGGALIGVWLGFWLTRESDADQQRAEEADLLRAARQAAADNLALVAQLFDATNDEHAIPTYAMDPALLDALLPRLVLICRDAHLLHELNQFRYQVHHLNRKVDYWFSHADEGLVEAGIASVFWQQRRGVLMNSIRESIALLRRSGQERLPPLLERRLAALAAPTAVKVRVRRLLGWRN